MSLSCSRNTPSFDSSVSERSTRSERCGNKPLSVVYFTILRSKFTILKSKRVRFSSKPELLPTECRWVARIVLRPNFSILAPGYLGTPPKARDKLAENSRNFAFYESAFTSQAIQARMTPSISPHRYYYYYIRAH